MKKIFLAAAALLLGLSSCTKEGAEQGNGNPEGNMTVRFTLSLPGGGDIVYQPKTRGIQDDPECDIANLSLYEFAVDGTDATFLQKHAFTAAQLTEISMNEYSFSMTLPAANYGEKRKFVFVANDAAVTDPAVGTIYDVFCQTLASTVLATNDDASKLAPSTGIVMSGVGKVNNAEEFTLTSSFSCAVEMTRIVARVDVVNNTPNMVITKIAMKNAAAKGYLMPQSSQTAPGAPDYIADLAMNTSATLGATYADQNNSGAGIQKALYMYERENAEGNGATIEIEYTINGSTQGAISVPFQNTTDQNWVNTTRNHLYKVVLGNGEAITTGKVEVQLFDEDWNVVEIPSEMDVEQDKMNMALKVNMFTPYNAKSVDLSSKTINSFYDKLAVSLADCPTDSYFKYSDLQTAGATASNVIFTDGSGNQYRLPTEGELNLLLPMWTEVSEREQIDATNKHWGVYHPWWNDNTSTNNPADGSKDSYVMATNVGTTGWTETIYLKNGADFFPDKTTNAGETDGEYVVSGKSWMKRGTTTETDVAYPSTPGTSKYNIAPVYGLRFQGTSQYAAYRWESRQIASNPLERYLSIKIKALKKDDGITTIDDVAQESFWADGTYIEFKFPASGYYGPSVTPDATNDNISDRGVNGDCWSSSLWGAGTSARTLGFCLHDAFVRHGVVGYRFPLRFVRVQE